MLGLVLALSLKHSSVCWGMCWPYLLNIAPYVGGLCWPYLLNIAPYVGACDGLCSIWGACAYLLYVGACVGPIIAPYVGACVGTIC